MLSITTVSPGFNDGIRFSFRYVEKRSPVVPPGYVIVTLLPSVLIEESTVVVSGVFKGV